MSKNNIYWTQETDDKIKEYQSSGDQQIYEQYIHPAFVRLTEAIIRGNRSKDLSEYQNDLISYCWSKISKYDPSRSGFSFFNYIAKNYYMWITRLSTTSPRSMRPDVYVSIELIKEEYPNWDVIIPEKPFDFDSYITLAREWWKNYLEENKTMIHIDFYRHVIFSLGVGVRFHNDIYDAFLRSKGEKITKASRHQLTVVLLEIKQINRQLYKYHLAGVLLDQVLEQSESKIEPFLYSD